MWTECLTRFVGSCAEGNAGPHMPTDGRTLRHGDGGHPNVTVTVTDPDLARRMVLNPDMALGEGYMDGHDPDRGRRSARPADAGAAATSRHGAQELARLDHARCSRCSCGWTQFNPVGRAKRNVAHHYDLSGELYDLFLDADRQYSCAYFRDPT